MQLFFQSLSTPTYMERIRRFELPHSAWKADMLPITSYPQIARLSGLSGVVKTTHPPPILFIDVDLVHLSSKPGLSHCPATPFPQHSCSRYY